MYPRDVVTISKPIRITRDPNKAKSYEVIYIMPPYEHNIRDKKENVDPNAIPIEEDRSCYDCGSYSHNEGHCILHDAEKKALKLQRKKNKNKMI